MNRSVTQNTSQPRISRAIRRERKAAIDFYFAGQSPPVLTLKQRQLAREMGRLGWVAYLWGWKVAAACYAVWLYLDLFVYLIGFGIRNPRSFPGAVRLVIDRLKKRRQKRD
ncbi:MAG: hypothetical protein ISN29_05220 [Gammaproteobacteria bacterium AqS3]|nr:hypothetical protein [Gammaproteobacteria bacterium AqS3]